MLKKELAEHLLTTNGTKNIFDDQKMTRKQRTVWCTLGHYHRYNDFKIDKELYNIFMDSKCYKFNRYVRFNTLDIVEFSQKNLVSHFGRFIFLINEWFSG